MSASECSDCKWVLRGIVATPTFIFCDLHASAKQVTEELVTERARNKDLIDSMNATGELLQSAVMGKAAAEHRVAALCEERDALRALAVRLRFVLTQAIAFRETLSLTVPENWYAVVAEAAKERTK